MENKKFFKSKNIPLVIQSYLISQKYPEAKCEIKKNQLIWEGKIKPTSLSREYNIRIICNGTLRPQVILYGDKIEGIEREDFPHHFKIDKDKPEVYLCLHLPKEFNYSYSIHDTIIPWTQEWLYFYEIWLSTGKWCGGGHTPRKI